MESNLRKKSEKHQVEILAIYPVIFAEEYWFGFSGINFSIGFAKINQFEN